MAIRRRPRPRKGKIIWDAVLSALVETASTSSARWPIAPALRPAPRGPSNPTYPMVNDHEDPRNPRRRAARRDARGRLGRRTATRRLRAYADRRDDRRGPDRLGSVFTSDALVRAALALLEPLYRGENALEPERVSEKLHQNTFWLGPRRFRHAHHQRHRHRPLGPAGQGRRAARRAGCWAAATASACKPYASLLMQEPAPLAEHLRELEAQGFRAFKIGWGPFGRTSSAAGRGDRPRGARSGRRRNRC